MPADSLERVFSLIEMNAEHVPIFRKFLAAERLSWPDVLELAKQSRALGLFEFSELVRKVGPETMKTVAEAHGVIERAAALRVILTTLLD